MVKRTKSEKDAAARRKARRDRLTKPSISRAVAEKFGVIADEATEDTINEAIEELKAYRGPDRAYRQANEYYYGALAKVYKIWIQSLSWPAPVRQRFYLGLNEPEAANGDEPARRTSRGTDLHILLRYMISYSGDARAEQRLRTRDAGALRQASRLELTPDAFVHRSASGIAGLDALYRADISARREEEGLKAIKPITPRAVSLKGISGVIAKAEDSVAEKAPKFLLRSLSGWRWRWSKVLRRKLQSARFHGREVILRVYVDDRGKTLTIRDCHQITGTTFKDEAWSGIMEGVGARLVEKGLKRPKKVDATKTS
ncbi:hypothetical protein [Brevundimonas diminuta]|uniref:hypothetical protein n=1 Tax=Brevundimonas diminuta TaxID=293 RepID=UPI001F5A1284|nr:hypothetical protein [Brevundimonas diminuta]